MNENENENENENAEPGIFGDLIEGLEEELNAKLLEKRAAYALACARITGAVYVEAVAAGTPADLAKEMATDAWMKSMGIPTPQIIAISADEDDD